MEAALILPLFLLVSLVILSFIDVMRCSMEKQMQQHELLRKASVYASVGSYAINGREGDYITLDYVYPISLTVGGFGFKNVFVRQRSKVHIFNGYDDSAGDRIGQQQEYVYVAKHGTVYHKKRSCQTICVSVQEVSAKTVNRCRNMDGKKYRKCSICAKGYTQKELIQGSVYISDYGVKYHVRMNCSELIRTVRVIKAEEAAGLTPCKICS